MISSASLVLMCYLFSLILIGWGISFARILKTDLSIGLLNATAFCGLALFFSFIVAIPTQVVWVILSLGAVFFLYFLWCVSRGRNRALYQDYLATILCYLALCSLSIFIAYGMKFRSIDDYSFWGTISKYLFIFNALPNNDHYINNSFLTYTPGMASFHYLIYTLAKQYSQLLGYFAQGLVLISAMIVFFNPKKRAQSIVNLSVLFILFTLAYGTVFARMEVDAYVAAYFFITSWLIYKKGSDAALLILLPIVFLSIIKEIGLLFAVFSILMLVVLEMRQRKAWINSSLLVLCVLTTKLIWKWHTTAHGFNGFSHAITLQTALDSFNPFNPYYHQVQWLYLKEIILGPFDHILKIPNFCVYLLIAGLFYSVLKKPSIDSLRVKKIMGLYVIFTLIYLAMLYCLQALVFNVGHGNERILDFQRYYNMLFLPWLSLMVFIKLDASKQPSFVSLLKPIPLITLITASVLLVGGKMERSKKFYQPNNLYATYTLIEKQASLLPNTNWSLCLQDLPEPAYETTMPLSYFFMPNRIFYPATKEHMLLCDMHLSAGKNLRTPVSSFF